MLPGARMARIIDAIGLHRAKKLNCCEAAEMLDLSERHVRWLRDAHEAEGVEAFVDGRRRRASGRRAPVDEIKWVIEEFRTRYFDFTEKHFHEAILSRPATLRPRPATRAVGSAESRATTGPRRRASGLISRRSSDGDRRRGERHRRPAHLVDAPERSAVAHDLPRPGREEHPRGVDGDQGCE